ncbi:MAG TPA: 3',5'-cyclic-nucleotide phosphodiesterase [Nitrospirae bacterium]|nr:3',5'-cyclic-nucleotide phosphodiesterase [Nitrospirota bacterium]
MKLQVLGCSGSGLPNHNPPAFLINKNLLLDGGTISSVLDERAQSRIRHILITHAHLDHTREIPSFADNMFLRNGKHNISLVGVKDVLQPIKKNMFNNIVWPDFTSIPSPAKPVIKLKTIKTGINYKVGDYKIIAERTNHSIPSTGFIIKGPFGKKLLYTGDTGPTVNLWQRANKAGYINIDGAVIEVTFPNRMRDAALRTGHLTPALLSDELKKLERPPLRIFITHTKPQFLKTISRELINLKIKKLTILKQGKTYTI